MLISPIFWTPSISRCPRRASVAIDRVLRSQKGSKWHAWTHYPALSHIKSLEITRSIWFGLFFERYDCTHKYVQNTHRGLLNHKGRSFPLLATSLMVMKNVFTQVHKRELGLLCFSKRLGISKKYWQCRPFFSEQALKPCWNLISMSRFKNSHLYIGPPLNSFEQLHLLLCLLIMCEQKHGIHSALGTRNHCKSFLSPCGLSGRQIQSKHEFLGIYYKYIMWLNCAGSPAMDLYSLSLRTPIFPAVIFPKGKPAHWALFKRRANLNTATI